jgi:hypothetical protein
MVPGDAAKPRRAKKMVQLLLRPAKAAGDKVWGRVAAQLQRMKGCTQQRL